MHRRIWLCNGILVISSATDLISYSLYEELNSSKFLCSLCMKDFRFSFPTPTLLYTGTVRQANKQENLGAVFWHGRLFQYPRTMTLQPNRKNNPPKETKKESVKKTIVFPVGSTNHLPNTAPMLHTAGWQSAGIGRTRRLYWLSPVVSLGQNAVFWRT